MPPVTVTDSEKDWEMDLEKGLEKDSEKALSAEAVRCWARAGSWVADLEVRSEASACPLDSARWIPPAPPWVMGLGSAEGP
jgi:hypothetical protein